MSAQAGICSQMGGWADRHRNASRMVKLQRERPLNFTERKPHDWLLSIVEALALTSEGAGKSIFLPLKTSQVPVPRRVYCRMVYDFV